MSNPDLKALIASYEADAGTGATKLSYGMNTPQKRRKLTAPRITAESVNLNRKGRVQGQASAQQQVRDLSMLAWMIRRHLDYVSSFRFHFRTATSDADTAHIALDDYIGTLFDWHAQPVNFDVAARLGREEGFRMFEDEKTTGGDAGFLKINSMLALQAIESDLIAMPKMGKLNARGKNTKLPKVVTDSVHPSDGCIYSTQFPGRVEQWCLCNRGKDGKGLNFDQLVPADSLIFGRYITRFSSQTRGVSPLSTCLNSCSDLYNSIDLNLAKQRIHALLGFAIFRDYSGGEFAEEFGEVADNTEDAPADGQTDTGQLELKPDIVSAMDMDTNGRVDMLESKTPSNEFREFIETIARIILLALDIPYSAWNSGSSSFSGIMADQNMYEVSCKGKRRKNEWARKDYSDWLLTETWNGNAKVPDFGDFQALATAAGLSLEQVKQKVEWIASGMPWLQKLQEITGDIMAIAAGLDNPIDAARRKGSDVFANIEKTRQVLKAAGDDVPLMFGNSGGIRSAQELIDSVTEIEGANDEL